MKINLQSKKLPLKKIVTSSVIKDLSAAKINLDIKPGKFTKQSHGFTLIEVLIALAILAIGLTALLKTSAENISQTNRVKEKTIKHWVAMQAINKIQMQNLSLRPGLPTTSYYKAFGKTWYFQARLIPTKIKKVQKIIIKVSGQQHTPYTDPLMAFYHEK